MVHIEDAGDGIRVAAVTGDTPLQLARGQVVDALVAAQADGIRRFAIDVTESTGLGAPHLAVRLDVVREWASVARHGFSLAFIGPEAIMDGERVGLVMARGLGLNVEVFCTRHEAIAWLARQSGFDRR